MPKPSIADEEILLGDRLRSTIAYATLICIHAPAALSRAAVRQSRSVQMEILRSQQVKPRCSIGTIGQVGHGKTTLTAAITRLLAETSDTQFTPVDELNRTAAVIRPFAIPAARIVYETEKRRYSHADWPDHTTVVRGMIAGAVGMDGAILVVSAEAGVMPETREQVLLAGRVGVPAIVVFLNKCDLVDDPELLALAEGEVRELLSAGGFPVDSTPIIRGSALAAIESGDDKLGRGAILALLKAIDEIIPQPAHPTDQPFLMPIDRVSRAGDAGILVSGRIERGFFNIGNEIEIVGLRDTRKATIVSFDDPRKVRDEGQAGDNIGALISGVSWDEVEPGQVLSAPGSVTASKRFKAEAYFLSREEGGRYTPLFANHRPQFRFHTTDVAGVVHLQPGVGMVVPGEHVSMEVDLVAPIALERKQRFAIREGGRLIGTGIISAVVDEGGPASEPMLEDVIAQQTGYAVNAPEATGSGEARTDDKVPRDGGLEAFPPGGGPPGRPKVFKFVLQGDQAKRNEVVGGTSFDLVFRYERIDFEDLMVQVFGDKLTEVATSDGSFGIDVVPKGLELIDEEPHRSATFANGSLLEPWPRWHMVAPAGLVGNSEKTGIYVFFSRAGAQLYTAFIPIKVVRVLSSTPEVLLTVDLDAQDLARKPPVALDAAVYISIENGQWRVHWNRAQKSRQTTINLAALNTFLKDLIEKDIRKVANAPVWSRFNTQLEIEGGDTEGSLRECLESTMTAGSKLWKALRKDETMRGILEEIDKLEPGSKIGFTTEDIAFPWELLYPLHYDYGDGHFDPKLFWGARFEIESVLFPEDFAIKTPANRKQSGKLSVCMGVNSGLDKLPGSPFLPVKFHKDYFEQKWRDRGKYLTAHKEVKAALLDATPGSLVYLFCHGSEGELEIDGAQERLTPNSLDSENRQYRDWPLVFLNACSAADVSPLSFFSFRTEFRRKAAAGLVAPSFSVPTLFAAAFGKEVMDQYFARRRIGEILLDLRAGLLERNIPLGLWYSLQCPLDLEAPVE